MDKSLKKFTELPAKVKPVPFRPVAQKDQLKKEKSLEKSEMPPKKEAVEERDPFWDDGGDPMADYVRREEEEQESARTDRLKKEAPARRFSKDTSSVGLLTRRTSRESGGSSRRGSRDSQGSIAKNTGAIGGQSFRWQL